MSGPIPPRIVLLVVVGSVLIGALAWYDGAFDTREDESARPAENPASTLLEAARACGDVGRAITLLESAISQHGEWAGLLRHRRALERERDAVVGGAPDVLARLDALGIARPDATEVVRLLLDLLPPDDEVRAFFASAPSDTSGADARAARLDPRATDADAAASLARAFTVAGRPVAALRWHARAFAAAPHEPALGLALARACLAAELPAAAHAVLAAAVAAGADDPALWRLRADVASWRGALRAEAEARSRHAESHDELRRLAEVQLALGRPDLAFEPISGAARLSGSHQEYVEAAAVGAQADRIDDAVALLREARSTAPDPVVLDLRIARLLLDDLRPREALAHVDAQLATHSDRRLEERRDDLLRILGEYVPPTPAALETIATAEVLDPPEQAVSPRLSPEATLFVALAEPSSLADDSALQVAQALAASAQFGVSEWDDVRTSLSVHIADPRVRPILAKLLMSHMDLPGTRETALWFADTAESPARTTAIAATFAALRPGDVAWTAAWAERASWAGLADDEIRAREALRLLRRDDAANARRLIQLYAASGRLDDAIAAQRAVPESAEQRAELAALLAQKGDDPAAIGELIALSVGLSVAQRFELAEHLLGVRRIDEALALHGAILAEQPEHVGSLRRTAQLRSWGNDAEGALPFLDRLVELAPDGEAFYLRGEARFATQRDEAGRSDFERALPLLRGEAETDAQRKRMLAAVLARLAHPDEAATLFEELLVASPQDLHLHLDYAGAMFTARRLALAGTVLERARPLGANDQRFLRLEGALALEEHRYEDAERALSASLSQHGRDAGTLADLGRALYGRGALRGAVESLTEALERQPDNTSVRTFRREIADRVPHPTIETHLHSRTLADDERRSVRVEAATALPDERTAVGVVVARDRFIGRALALRRGRKDARATIESLGIGLTRRLEDAWTIGGGLDLYSGRPDTDGAGGWAEFTRRASDPYSSVSLRLHANEVWDDPTAAAALGGRTHGARLEWYLESDDAWWWLSGRLRYRGLRFEHPRRGRLSDPEILGEVSIGRQLLRDGPSVTDRVRPRHAPVAESGTTVAHESAEERGPRVSAWLSYAGLRVRGDADAEQHLPYSDRFDYVSLTVHATQTLVPGVHVDVEAFFGRELHANGSVGALSAALAWRPNEEFEVRIGGRRGEALGRNSSGDAATDLELSVVLRW